MNRQRGSVLLYGLLALFVVTAAGGIVYTYTHAIERAQKAEADNEALRQVNSEFAAENQNLRMLKARQDLLLTERQASRNTAAEIERKVDAKLSSVYRQSQPAREWRDAPVPADVLAGVRADAAARAPGKDGALPAPGQPPGAPGGR